MLRAVIREHITAAINDAAAEASEADDDLGPVEVLRAVVAGCGRAGVTELDVAELQHLADDMSGPPWP